MCVRVRPPRRPAPGQRRGLHRQSRRRGKALPGRFKDWVAMPKFNMYQALHTTVIGPEGRPLEIQIRTMEMHRTAEYGVAAHWIYKVDGAKPKEGQAEWLAHLLDWQDDMKDPQEFAQTLRADLFEDEVFVFTPKGCLLYTSPSPRD